MSLESFCDIETQPKVRVRTTPTKKRVENHTIQTQVDPDNEIDYRRRSAFTKESQNYAIMEVRIADGFLTKCEELKRGQKPEDDSYGGYWSSGGLIGCAKHMDLVIERFEDSCKPYAETLVLWSHHAENLYHIFKELNIYRPVTEYKNVNECVDALQDYHLFRIDFTDIHTTQKLDDIKHWLDKFIGNSRTTQIIDKAKMEGIRRLKDNAKKSMVHYRDQCIRFNYSEDSYDYCLRDYEMYQRYSELSGQRNLSDIGWLEDFKRKYERYNQLKDQTLMCCSNKDKRYKTNANGLFCDSCGTNFRFVDFGIE